MKNPDDLAKTQFLTKYTDITFTHEICGLGLNINTLSEDRRQGVEDCRWGRSLAVGLEGQSFLVGDFREAFQG